MAQDSIRERTDCAKMAQKILFEKRYSIQQYKTPKIRSDNSRAGLSYTVASRELVHQVPPQRSLNPPFFREIPIHPLINLL